jgi:signal transduction histidine kinase
MPIKDQPFYRNYERSLAIYALALSMIIALVTVSFFIERKILISQDKFAMIINMSGKQRMLSQRLGALSLQSMSAKSDAEIASIQSIIKKDLNELRQLHLQLNQEGKTQLNTDVTNLLTKQYRERTSMFFNSVDLMTTPAVLNSLFREQVVQGIYPQASNDMLNYFEQMTVARENRANAIVHEYLDVKYFLFATTIILILAEGLLIFYPQAKRNLSNAEQIIELHNEEDQLKKFSELGESFSRAMHEINNPLTVIAIKSKQLLGKPDLPSDCRKGLEQIQINTDRIVKIIKSTKAIYRKGDNDPQTYVNLKNVALEAMESSRLLREAEDIKFQLDNLDDATIKGREHQIFQVFVNLITNAIDSLNEANLEEKKIVLEVMQDRNEALFRISDNGPGIPPENEEIVFKGLYTTKTYGTGMGLSESKRLVELHKGTLKINHEISNSCFEVHYPNS